MLQCLSNALTRASSFLLFRHVMSTWEKGQEGVRSYFAAGDGATSVVGCAGGEATLGGHPWSGAEREEGGSAAYLGVLLYGLCEHLHGPAVKLFLFFFLQLLQGHLGLCLRVRPGKHGMEEDG